MRNMEKVQSHSEFLRKAAGEGKHYLLLFKEDSEQSRCAYHNIETALKETAHSGFFSADVSVVKDIHQHYQISSVPALLVFENGRMAGIIKGCHESNYYKALVEEVLYTTRGVSDAKSSQRVTVYSTPTCTWCNTLKAWLLKNNIKYTDIDISGDQRAADDLVRRSGQQGVPQTDINGKIVVGFNQPLLKELLNIN